MALGHTVSALHTLTHHTAGVPDQALEVPLWKLHTATDLVG